MHHLQLILNQREGALLRTLGVVERRGFTTRQFRTAEGPRPSTWLVDLQVSTTDGLPTRCPNVLSRHLAKIHDVEHVRVIEQVVMERPVSW